MLARDVVCCSAPFPSSLTPGKRPDTRLIYLYFCKYNRSLDLALIKISKLGEVDSLLYKVRFPW